jgi:diguanylate cyclase (GGDEF)-like protein
MNRRAFNDRLSQEVNRAKRYGTPLSLVMVDLDAFKEVNDQYGHSVGDQLLRAVGVLLISELRSTDLAVRYGGDEFALILPGTNKTDAWAVAEKLRASMRALVVETGEGVRIGTTVSVGVAAVTEQANDDEALLEHADAALYRAKRAGRDRVELAAG